MKKRTENLNPSNSRLMDISQLMEYTSLGRNKAAEFGKEIGATVRVGRRILFDRRKIDDYFDSLTGVE